MGYALLCCSAICCVAQLIVHLHLAWLCNCVCCIQGNTFLYVFLIVHLHLAWLCNCVCCIQGNTFLYVFHRMLRVWEFQVVPAPL